MANERKREEKRLRREAKAARKAVNARAEKKERPSNILIAALIAVLIIGLFAAGKAAELSAKEATIESYLENNGGEEVFSGMTIDEMTTADITAKKNRMQIVLDVTETEEGDLEDAREFYAGDDGRKFAEYLEAYFLSSITSETRAFFSDAVIEVRSGDEVLFTDSMTRWDAERYLAEANAADEEEAEEK